MKANFKNIKLEIFGESHAKQIGVKLSGVPSGESIALEDIQTFLDRRKSNSSWSTPRKEDDIVLIQSGIVDGVTNGEEICAIIENKDIKKSDYSSLLNKPRPSHADYTAYLKDGEISTGGGRFSGRMTAPLCIAGAIAKQFLQKRGVEILSYISQIGSIKAPSYTDTIVSKELIECAQTKQLAALCPRSIEKMIAEVESVKAKGDSVGGEIECVVFGFPAGYGDALFDGLEGAISYALFAIPAVKAVAFGLGFDFAKAYGSSANDAFAYKGDKVITLTNNNGGINGGISNGMPLVLKVAIKPTPSISLVQKSVDLLKKENTTIKIEGRHDACIVPRALPCVESAVALALLDCYLEGI